MNSETTLLKAKYAIHNTSSPSPQVLENAGVLIEGNKIVEVNQWDKMDHTADTVVDLPHHVLMPGLVNAHSHAAMTLFRGYADDLPLQEWLNDYIWPIERKMTPEDVLIGAKLAAIEALMSGTTLFNSQYWHPRQEALAFREVGVRLLCGPPTLSGMAELRFPHDLISEFHGKNDDAVRISMNPHAPYTVSPDDYQKINEFVRDFNLKHETLPPMIVHTHIAEADDEMKAIRSFAEREGFSVPADAETPVQYMNAINALTDFTLAAHAIEVPASDIEILAKTGVSVSINTESNMKLANRAAPVQEYLNAQMKVGLGTDSACSNNTLDMFGTMKATAILQKGFFHLATRLPAPQIIHMATYGGAQAMGWTEVGDLKRGMYADIIAIDLNKPHLHPIPSTQTLLSHIVYAAKGSDVSDAMVGGKWKMRNRTVLSVNLEEVLNQFEQEALALLNKR